MYLLDSYASIMDPRLRTAGSFDFAAARYALSARVHGDTARTGFICSCARVPVPPAWLDCVSLIGAHVCTIVPPGPGITIIECISGYANTVLRSTYTPIQGVQWRKQIAWTVRCVWIGIPS